MATPFKNIPPGPQGIFLLGNTLQWFQNPFDFLLQCDRGGYGDIVPFNLVIMSPYLLLNLDDIEYILGSHTRDFVKSQIYHVTDTLNGPGLLLSEGDAWARQRRLMQPAFHQEHLASWAQMMVEYAEGLLATWQEGQTLEVYETMLHLSMRVMTQALFGYDVNNDTTGLGKALWAAYYKVLARYGNPLPIPDNWPIPGNWRYLANINRLNPLVYDQIRQHRANPRAFNDVLSLLMLAHTEQGDTPFTDQELRDQTLTLMLGGYDSTACGMSWIWYLLSQHPEVEAKLVAELETVLGGRSPTLADLPQLRYTEMVFKEAFRIMAPTPIVTRRALKDFEMRGYHFRAGSELWVSAWVLHRSSRYYEAPDKFWPERWEGDFAQRLPKFAYVPFSDGPRGCIGSGLASLEVKLVLATIAQKYRFELVPNQVVAPSFAGQLSPQNGIKMVLRKRRPAA